MDRRREGDEVKVPPVRIQFSEEDRQEILARIGESLSSGMLTLGRNVREFEEAFGEAIESPYAVAVNSGTSAIEIAMRILGVEGREVIVPTNTFFATPAAVIHAGGKVRFVDADPDTFGLNVDHLAKCISPETAGVIAVHIGGLVTPRMPEIQRLCEERGIFLFEDAAHAHGSMLGTKYAGTFGIASAFSFYPTKIITSGEGGMLVTADERIKEEAEKYRDQGKRSFSENIHDKLGSNWRMSEPHAAIGLQHLKNLMEFIEERNEIAAFYDEVLGSIPGITHLNVPDECVCNYYKYIAILDKGIDRALVKRRLREEWDVGLSGEVYEVPCHRQPIFQKDGQESLTDAEDICNRHVCLPIYNGMTEEEMYHTAHGFASILKEHERYKETVATEITEGKSS